MEVMASSRGENAVVEGCADAKEEDGLSGSLLGERGVDDVPTDGNDDEGITEGDDDAWKWGEGTYSSKWLSGIENLSKTSCCCCC